MTNINKNKIKKDQLDRMSTTSTNLKRYEEMLKKFSKYSLTIEIVLVLVSTVFAVLNYINEDNNFYMFSVIFSLTLPISLVYLHLFHNKNDLHYNVRNAYLQIDELFVEINLLEKNDSQFDYKFEILCSKYQNAVSKTENVPSEIHLIEQSRKNSNSEQSKKNSNSEQSKKNSNSLKKSLMPLLYSVKLFLRNMSVDLIILIVYIIIYIKM